MRKGFVCVTSGDGLGACDSPRGHWNLRGDRLLRRAPYARVRVADYARRAAARKSAIWVDVHDPIMFLTAGRVALFAALLPSKRAPEVDPVISLRTE